MNLYEDERMIEKKFTCLEDADREYYDSLFEWQESPENLFIG